ncbi:MAG: hypothetical protein R6X33_04610 [Candidatus Brocadiia bacterium]
MSIVRKVTVVALILTAFPVWAVRSARLGEELETRRCLCDVRLLSVTALTLGGDTQITVEAESGQLVELPLVLHARRYECTAARGTEAGVVKEPKRELTCYELRSAEGAVSYEFSIWFFGPAGRFRVVHTDQGNAYLTFIQGTQLYLVPVSERRDRLVALSEFMAAGMQHDYSRVPVESLVPEAGLWGVNAVFSDIDVLELEEAQGDALRVLIADPDGNQYLFVGSGSDWSLEE